MFEKSLYDLIRGLRNHKGNEKEYIASSVKECRAEIRGQDMDVKATALLKLMYLEMFGYDMSWAAFHVLEVMSSPKYLQKRIGYLGAVQSFRPDTEVLMLATNLLKKDLTATAATTMSLPIITLPHIITPSLAMSVLSDLLPRLTHSSPAVRKKTIVTLYRLALVYPETLRPFNAKIKERLMDENEDPSVTAAIVNVICELGWRRPRDFLPLAPRLFELLVEGGNNWMVIKLIKLFATLTPLEPRLARKLLPPLTNFIRETAAMSVLYECIDGIIQGGILDDSSGGDEIANLCVSKLRGMIMVEGDPNLKFVALLAFNKIVTSHPYLVAQQEDVIMDCIDSPDMSIRLRALDLVVGMVSSENLMSVVGRLMRQLRNSPVAAEVDEPISDTGMVRQIEPMADSDDDELEETLRPDRKNDSTVPLPDDYKIDVIGRVLDMCSANNYRNLVDFDWYIDILIQLLRNAPISRPQSRNENSRSKDIAERIGDELRNVAVKVKSIRPAATQAAESVIIGIYNETLSKITSTTPALRAMVWIIGEYASYLSSPDGTLTALLQISKKFMPADQLVVCVQAIPKLFALIAGDENQSWTPERKIMMSLLMARIIHAMEPMATHPDLEVQERAVEFLELLKLAAEATAAQDASTEEEAEQEAPLLLTQAIPALFSGMELNSVALGAQRNVPVPDGLDLDRPINLNLDNLLRAAELSSYENTDHDEYDSFYHEKPKTASTTEPAISRLVEKDQYSVSSYQQDGEESYLDPDILARRRAERRERNKDDPFYIADNNGSSGTSTPLPAALKNINGQELDIDQIPIMPLDLGGIGQPPDTRPKKARAPSSRQRLHVAADETLPSSGTSTPGTAEIRSRMKKGKQSLLQVDSSNIGNFSLEDDDDPAADPSWDYERKQQEDAEMAKEIKRLEQLRMEMQRASERIETAKGVPDEGTVVKKKVKKKPKTDVGVGEGGNVVKKKKKKKQHEDGGGEAVAKPKKKKKAEGESQVTEEP